MIRKFWTKEVIIDALQKLPKREFFNYKILNEYYKKGLLCRLQVIYEKFGSIKNACEKAGIKCNIRKITRGWTKENIIKALKELPKDKLITTKTLKEYNKKGLICSVDEIYMYFNRLSDACNEAGIQHNLAERGWNKEKIVDRIKKIYYQYGKVKRSDFYKFNKQKNICGYNIVRKKFSSIDEAIKSAGLEVDESRNIKWTKKEKLGIEISKEIYGNGIIKPHIKTELGMAVPDYVPFNVNNPIVDIKSSLGDCSTQQMDKYERIRGNMRFMVFDNKGIIKVPEEKVIYMREIIKLLPNNKQIIFLEKWERIKKDVPIEQTNIERFIKEGDLKC